MRRLLAFTCFALGTMLPTGSHAGIVKDFATTIRYNAEEPPLGWYALDGTVFGFPTKTVFLWPASKGVAKALGKLNKATDQSCTIEYDADNAIAGSYGVYLNVYKAKCTPLP